MNPTNETHASEAGLLVADVGDAVAADDATTLVSQQLLTDRWATATAEHTTRDAGESGVRLRCYPDLRRPANLAAASADAVPEISAAASQ
ncbi:DUF6207 family protein [Streptomyces sp. BK205]|uniref:DUF6207 family protein n=1 Tax=Streptomyces sp. BK205 TaxID=2512164 RepID=UPI001051BE26|nr:DUF6207 family protein [Streptomyces sp. BK205]TCR16919.1 hypothetical protein EV578_113250 [Streptomyces sp. BK205]